MNASQTKIGFIGLGTMGQGMARSLLRAGFVLHVYNRSPNKTRGLSELGAVVVDSPMAAAEEADVVITMLADGNALREVCSGPTGIFSVLNKDCVLIDCSTIDPATSLSINEQVRQRGAEMLDAPVFGSKREADNASLGLIVGGERRTYDRVEDVLRALGKPFHVGANGMGSYTKLVVQIIIAGTIQLWNEGMVLATKAGLTPDTVHQVIMSCRARSAIMEMKAPQVLNRDFTPFFALRLMDKDLRLAVSAAEANDISLPLTTRLKDVFATCMETGLGDEDFSASIKYVEQLANVMVAAER